MPQVSNSDNQDVHAVGQPAHAPAGFGERLVAAGEIRGRLCVGIDPHAHLLHAWGLDDTVDGLRSFSRACVEAFADSAALVKPQVSFYERFGSQGLAVLEETLADLRSAGCLTLADAKRGDIGSTMQGYADAWLDESSPLCSDSVTVSPYLGVGSLQPVFDVAQKLGKGVFVLAATSNPEARGLQSARFATGNAPTVAQHVVDECGLLNHRDDGKPGDIGIVLGATVTAPPDIHALNGPVLLPGVGAQGATAGDVAELMKDQKRLGFANVSRAILSQGPGVSELREAVKRTADDFWDGPFIAE